MYNTNSEGTVTLSTLPVEIQLLILKNLSIPDLHTLSQTCRSLYRLINNDELWKRLFDERYKTTNFSSLSNSHKFAVELIKRDETHRQWKRGNLVDRNTPLRVNGIHDILLSYPRLTTLTDQGELKVISLDGKNKSKIEYEMPVMTMNGCTSFVMSPKWVLFGRFDGRIFCKALGPSKTAFVTSMVKFPRDHESAVMCLDCDELNGVVYSGDEQGNVWLWDIKTKTVLKEIKVGESGLKVVKGYGKTIFAVDMNKNAYLIDAMESEVKISKLELIDTDYETYDFDFQSSTLITTDVNSLNLFKLSPQEFGKHYQYSVYSEDSIHSIAIERTTPTRQQDRKLAGQDGRHLAVMLKSGIVLTFNLRNPQTQNSQLEPLAFFYPEFDSLKIPDGIPPISAIDVNSTVVLATSFNGYAAIYDVLTGEFIRVVSSRIPKKYLPLTEAPFIVPTRVAKLGEEKHGCFGISVTSDVVQYFQCGELKRTGKGKYNQSDKKGNVVGAIYDKKNKFHKLIRHGMADLEYETHQEQIKEKLLTKYNGNDADIQNEQEELELAMVLNQSLNDGETEEDDLEVALALSKLEIEQGFNEADDQREEQWQEIYDNSGVQTHVKEEPEDETNTTVPDIDDEDEEFQRQIEEAMRRSMLEN